MSLKLSCDLLCSKMMGVDCSSNISTRRRHIHASEIFILVLPSRTCLTEAGNELRHTADSDTFSDHRRVQSIAIPHTPFLW